MIIATMNQDSQSTKKKKKISKVKEKKKQIKKKQNIYVYEEDYMSMSFV